MLYLDQIPPTHICTHTKRVIDIANIQETDIDLRDITWSLAGQNRWAAHGSAPFFVSDHSLYVYSLMVKDAAGTPVSRFRGLTHDFHEAYTSDIPAPIKAVFRKFGFEGVLNQIENRIDKAIQQSLGIPAEDEDLIHKYDLLARSNEFSWLFNGKPLPDNPLAYDRSKQSIRSEHFLCTIERAAIDAKDYINARNVLIVKLHALKMAAERSTKSCS